jgi:hypothetical protein
VDGMLLVGRRKHQADTKVADKVHYALKVSSSASGLYGGHGPLGHHGSHIRRPGQLASHDDHHHVSAHAHEYRMADKKLLKMTNFGAYSVSELLAFYKAFLSLPRRLVAEEVPVEPQISSDSAGDVSVTSTDDGRNGDNNNDNDDNTEGGDGHDDDSVDSRDGIEIAEWDPSAIKPTPHAPAAVAHSHEGASISTYHADQKSIDIIEDTSPEIKLTITVSLEALMASHFFKIRKDYKSCLEDLMDRKCVGDVLARHVFCSLEEIITAMCPYMSAHERRDCIRYLNLKMPIAAEAKRAIARYATIVLGYTNNLV